MTRDKFIPLEAVPCLLVQAGFQLPLQKLAMRTTNAARLRTGTS